MEKWKPSFELNLMSTFKCGEVFGWTEKDRAFYGMIGTEPVTLKQDNDVILYEGNVSEEDLNQFFDADYDYTKLESLCTTSYEKKVLEWNRGARIIQQDPEMVLLCNLLTPRQLYEDTRSNVNNICKLFGTLTKFGFYSFPRAKDIDVSKVPFMGPNTQRFKEAVLRIQDGFELMPRGTNNYEMFRRLRAFKGAGDKTVSLTALRGYGVHNTLPLDTHVEKVITRYYLGESLHEKFGDAVGIMSQYIWSYDKWVESF